MAVKPGDRAAVAVNRPADALFFLHTAVVGDEKAAAGKPVGAYTVRYADGQTATVPVTFGQTVGPWRASDPRALPGAAVGWAAKAPGGGPDLVVYQTQWTNPRPGVAVAGVSVSTPAGGPGTLVLVGLSAGVAK